jgi:hypothetical protein
MTFNSHFVGYTPLYVAILGHHWETARLVLAIAFGQYNPDNKEEEFSMKDIVLGQWPTFTLSYRTYSYHFRIDSDFDDDSNDGSEGSCESDETIDQHNAVNFTDVAKQPSRARCKIRPQKMLCEMNSEYIFGTEVHSTILLSKAIVDGELETFVHIADLYTTISEPLDHTGILEAIIAKDRAEILDEFIRRTGSGLDAVLASDDGDAHTAQSKSNLYPGLSVHGKKRKDLARKNDPNATQREIFVVPLLWKAVRAHALAIVTYLSGERPLAAYRFYFSTKSDERAERLRRTANLESVLPEWLGWQMSALNESPLTAAVLGNELDMIKILFETSPKLMRTALHER